ncbi:MAG: CPBP family intramembrane metalloprotease [Gemmatimonadales bacterium]|nr:MAG: CPBP family intramembrane metalloprotease [Gemmatimonadales bacterium]
MGRGACSGRGLPSSPTTADPRRRVARLAAPPSLPRGCPERSRAGTFRCPHLHPSPPAIPVPARPSSSGPDTPSPGQALLFVAGLALLYVVVGVTLQILFGEAGMAMAQVGVFLLPALLLVRLGGFSARRTLALRPASARGVAAAALLMAGGLPLAWLLAWLQSFVIPVPEELLQALTDMILTDDPVRIVWLVLLVAVLPAICEEVVFRGVLLSGLRSRLPVVGAILLSGVVFGIFHLAPGTAFRFLPTAWLGILLAWIVVETRSIFPAILMHFLNNGAILALTLWPVSREMASATGEAPPVLLLVPGLILFVAGARLLREEGRHLQAMDHGGQDPATGSGASP